MKKLLFHLISVSVPIIFTLYFFFDSLIGKSNPDYNAEFNSNLISSDVFVYRDTFGIPTISAANNHDLYFAIGFTHAQDRIFQMDLLRRMGEGRLSEIYGTKTVNTDVFYRTIRLNSISLKQMESLSSEERNILAAYTEGVNNYLESNKNKLPIEFSILNYKPEEWNELNSLLIFNMFQWWIDQSPDKLSNDLHLSDSSNISFYRGENSFLLDYFENEKPMAAVIPAKHSLSGKPLFYSEISGNLTIPAKFYEYFIESNSVVSGGITLPGIPVALNGFSSSQVWAFLSLKSQKKIEKISLQNVKTEKKPEVIAVREEESINLVIEEFDGKINVSDLFFPKIGNSLFLSWKPDQSFSDLVRLSGNLQIPVSDHLLVLNNSGEINQPEIQNSKEQILILQNGRIPYKPDFRGKADSVDAAWMTYFLNEKLLGVPDLKTVSEIPDFNYSMKVKSVLLHQLFSDSSASGLTAKKYLSVWRADYSRQDIGASIFSVWNYLFTRHYSGEKTAASSKLEFQELTLNYLYGSIDADSISVRSIREAIQILKNRFGDDPVNWRWGNLNNLKFNPLLDEFAEETGKYKFDNTGYNFIRSMKNDSSSVMNQTGKQIIAFSDFEDSNAMNVVIPGGVSGEFDALHFSDQLLLFNSHQFLNIELSGFKNSKYKLTIRHEK